MELIRVGGVILLVLFGTVCINGQEVPAESSEPEIYSLHIRSDILFRYSTTLVTSRLANPNNKSTEAVFSVTLPNEAFISDFTMEIDGVIYPGEVKDKASAKKQFEKAKKKGQSAGHVSRARETNRFKVEVAVAALGKVTFNLTYQELLRRTRGVYRHRLYIDPGQPVDDMQVSVRIQESRPITLVRALPIQNDLLTNEHLVEENQIAIVDRPSSDSAHVTFTPSLADQTRDSDTGLSGQFIVEYDIERSLDAGDLLVVNGYFVHFIAPEVEKPIPKDILFIIDTSSSMSGDKLLQVVESMTEILLSLEKDDRFNVMEFSSRVALHFTKGMVQVTKKTLREATNYVKGLSANGGTNINRALEEGLRLLQKDFVDEEQQRAPIIVFLTDGEATSGVTSSTKILKNAKDLNEVEIPIFTLAYGSGADWGLLKKIAVQSNAVAKKIYQDSDANLQIANFYDELAVTLLKDVNVRYLDDEGNPQNLTSSGLKNYYRGSEMVVAGRISDTDAKTLRLELTSAGSDGAITLTPESNLNIIDPTTFPGLTSIIDISSITEKLWAYLTIKEAMKDVIKSTDKEHIAALKQKVLDLSLKYKFVTPLTSMVVTKPETEDDLEGEATTPAPTTPKPTTRPPRRYYSNRGGGGGGGYGGGGGGDPHYVLRLPGFEHPICFDVKSDREEVHNILTDPNKHVTINAQIIQSDIDDIHGDKKTFIGQLSITMKSHVIVITPDMIMFDTKMHMWSKSFEKHFGNNSLIVSKEDHVVTIQFKDGAQLVVSRHMKEKREPGAVNFLSLYINHEDGFGKHSTGLLGQFVNGHKRLILKKQFRSESGRTMAKIQIRQLHDLTAVPDADSDNVPFRQRIPARLVPRSHVLDSGTEFCWMIHQPFLRALYGDRRLFTRTQFLPVS